MTQIAVLCILMKTKGELLQIYPFNFVRICQIFERLSTEAANLNFSHQKYFERFEGFETVFFLFVVIVVRNLFKRPFTEVPHKKLHHNKKTKIKRSRLYFA